MCPSQTKKKKKRNEIHFPTDLSDLFQGFYTVFSLSLSSAGKGLYLTGIFLKQLI